MSLVYLEFISRRPGVSLEQFHAVAGYGQTGWAGDNVEDVLLGNLGEVRTIAYRDIDDALARANAGRFDLIVLDLMLPGMSGLEAARRLLRTR